MNQEHSDDGCEDASAGDTPNESYNKATVMVERHGTMVKDGKIGAEYPEYSSTRLNHHGVQNSG